MLKDNSKLQKIVLALFVWIFASAGVYFMFFSRAATPTTYYIATNGSDSNPCSQTAPCLTFNHAYTIATPGDTVQVAAGLYGAQTINYDANQPNGTNSTSANIVFEPAPGANVYLDGNITVLSSHVTFEGMTMGNPNASGNAGQSNPLLWHTKYSVEADDYQLGTGPSSLNNVGFITFQNIIGQNFNVVGAHDVSVIGGAYGPTSCDGSSMPNLTQYGGGNNALRAAAPNYPSGGPYADPYNILVDGVTIHNIMSYNLTDCHTEGLAIFAGSAAPSGSNSPGGVTVRNSKFYGNDVYDILAQANSGASKLGKITLQNNWFAAPTNEAGSGSSPASGVELDSISGNVAIDNNSFDYPLLFQDPAGSLSNVSIIGNILQGPTSYSTTSGQPGSMCGVSGVTAQYNLTQSASGQSCSSATNTSISSTAALYVNPTNDASLNFSLKSGSQAIGFVPTSADPVTNDIDYHCRPAPGQTNIDAGASELNATGTCGQPSGGSTGGGGTNPPPVNTPPTVSVTAPTSPVSGTVALTANASATTSGATITSVQFQIDGSNVGSAVATSPYSYNWDTTSLANSSQHAITAIAKDSNGLTTTSSPVTVTVNNATSPPPGGCTTTVSNANGLTSAVSTAAGGSTICVTGGNYTGMTWTGGSSRTSPVIVKPLNSTPVNITGTLTIEADQVNLEDISLAGQVYQIMDPAHDVQLTNIVAGRFEIQSEGTSSPPTNITIKGGSIGPWHSYPDNRIDSGNGTVPNKNVIIDGVTFHDIDIPWSSVLSGTHLECLQVWSANGLTIQNSRFENCSVFDIFIQRAAASSVPAAPTNVLIQNNYLDCCSYTDIGHQSNYAIMLPSDHGEGTWSNVTLRNNSSNDKFDFGSGPSVAYSNVVVENNIAPGIDSQQSPASNQISGIKTDYNLWFSGSKLGSHDLSNVSPAAIFANYGAANFDLIASSPAIDHGDPGFYPPTDIYGTARPQGTAPDIGANEFAGTVKPPPNPLTVTMTTPANQATVSGTVKLSATTSGGSSAVTGVQFQVDGKAITTSTASPYSASLDTTTLSNASHTLTAVASDGSGETASSSVVVTVNNGDTTPPSQPTGLTAQATAYNNVNLSWTASTDNVGVAGYYIVRGGVTIAQTAGTTYSDSSVSAKTGYSYQVIAYDAKGNLSQPSNAASVTTPSVPDTIPPTAPTNLSAQAVSSSQVNLNWTASTDNIGVVAYDIYEGAIKIASANTTSFGVTGLNPATSYSYYVVARDAAGNQSIQSNTATATTMSSSVIAGSNKLQPDGDYNLAGQAEAFKTTGLANDTANALKVYVDSNNSASKVWAGVYAANSSGKAANLLAQGAITNPQKGSWNSITLSKPVNIANGKTYWIAILGQGGALYFRDSSNGSSQISKSTSLTSLPSNWSGGTIYPDSPVSAYLYRN